MTKILIIDQNYKDRDRLSKLLARGGNRVQEVVSHGEALVLGLVEQPDLVISTLSASVAEGCEFAARLHSIAEQLPILLCSVNAAEVDASKLVCNWGAMFVPGAPVDSTGVPDALDSRLTEHSVQQVGDLRAGETDQVIVVELEKVEAALRVSEVQYRLYFEHNPIPGWLYDTKSLRFLDVNTAAILHYGYSRSEFLSMTINDIQPPGDNSALHNSWALTGSLFYNPGRTKHVRKDGTQIDVEVLAHSVVGGQPVQFALAQDVTEQCRTVNLTREASEYLNMALEASRSGVWTWNALGDKVVLDRNTRQLFGLTSATFGGSLADLLATLHPEDRDTLRSSIAEVAPSRPEITPEFRVVWPDGSVHHLACRGQAFFNHTSQIDRVTAVIHDISEQRLLEEKFRQTQKMEAVGRLAAGVAHDFNNILTVITGYCSLLISNPQRQGSLQKALKEMLDAAQRAATLTGQLLAFSKKQVLQPEVIDLRTTLRDIDRLVGWALGENIEVSILTGLDLATVRIDPNQIQQVILNLVVNARDAMPRGGKLTLEIKNIELDEIWGAKHDVPSGKYVSLVVSDTGVGMTPEVQQRAFEPFFTTKEKGSGTGLGLASVYGIVRQSGGCIVLDSTPNVGTIFRIFFPRLNQSPATVPHQPALMLRGGNETILVVEDDNEVRILVQEILGSVGYHTISAPDGETALGFAKNYEGEIRLLITDVVMQRIGGRESAERLASIRPAMKVLYMSGYTSDDVLRLGILDRNVNYLPKPFTSLALCEKIRSILDADFVLQRVLVVDQERSIRALLSAILEDNGFHVITAGNPLEAIASGANHSVDLVIADLAMPVEDGIQMISDLRKKNPRFRIIGMSGTFGSDVLSAAQKLGTDAMLNKPLTPAMVLECINGMKQSSSSQDV